MGLDDILIIVALVSALALFITFVYLFIAGNWMLLNDNDQKGWSILVPVWNIFAVYKLSGIKMFFLLIHAAFIGLLASGFVGDLNITTAVLGSLGCIVMNCVVGIGIAHRFNSSAGMGIGIGILPPIFIYVLAKRAREDQDDFYGYDQDYYYDEGQNYYTDEQNYYTDSSSNFYHESDFVDESEAMWGYTEQEMKSRRKPSHFA